MRKYLLSLLLVCVLFISFCSSDYFLGDSSTRFSLSSNSSYSSSCGGLCCFLSNNSNGSYRSGAIITYNNQSFNLFDKSSISAYNISCFNISGNYTVSTDVSNSIYVYPYDISSVLSSSCPSCPSQYTEEECKSEYDLVSSGDYNVCMSDLSFYIDSYDNCNGLLQICNINLQSCQNNVNSGNSCNTGNINWSSLFINNIQHLGAPIIDITIPEEFDWDYVSTDEEFTLDIEGYNVDTEYMNGIITTQTTLPNDIDFNNLISSVVPLFIPGLVVILFLYFIFKFIKKIF